MDDDKISAFSGVTGASTEQATFYLEAAGGDVESAINSYLEGAAGETGKDEDMLEDELDENIPTPGGAPSAGATPSQPRAGGGAYTLSGEPAPAMPAGWGASAGSSNSSSRSGTPANPFRSNAGPRVTGFRDLNASAAPGPSRSSGGGSRLGRVNHGGDDDDDEGENDPQSFFAGGEKSGLSVQNPNQGPSGLGGKAKDMMKNILQKAVDGANKVPGAPAVPSAGGSSLFSGSAHTLGSDDTPSTFIPDPTVRPAVGQSRVPGGFPGPAEADESDSEEETAVRTLTFWADGFSIDDGELLGYEDPGNAEILAAINSGRAPLSLLKIRHDQPVELRISKRLNEKWQRQPAPAAGPWGGQGQRLGSELDPSVTSSSSTAATGSATVQPPTNAPASAVAFEVDASQPVTSLQIRLRDGSRIVARFNHSHTVGDIRNYINASNPGQATAAYALQTTFPSKDLTDDSQTIKDANLLGSVIVQRGL